MTAFRTLLAVIFVSIAGYTLVTVTNHGLSLFTIFFGDMAEMAWPGQFNFDFLCFLVLSATWLSWRHHFSPAGLFFGVCGLFGGAFFLSAYLLIVSFKAAGDIQVILLGEQRSQAASSNYEL